MKRLSFVLPAFLSLGCLSVRPYQVKLYALSGNEIRVVQSRYGSLRQVPEFYTAGEELKIEIVPEGVPAPVQTVLWFRSSEAEAWQRGPASSPADRWIRFRPREGRYLVRASVVGADGSESLLPSGEDPPAFVLVVDRTPPTVSIQEPGPVLANTTTHVRFEVWDAGLGPTPSCSVSYSSDGGSSWVPLPPVKIEPGENSYRWEVPDTPGPDHMLRIRCVDMAGNEATAQTDRFQILPHPTPAQAIQRLLYGVQKKEEKDVPSEGPGASPAQPEKSAPPTQKAITVHVPKAVRPGEKVEVGLEGIDRPPPESLRLLYQPAPTEAWETAVGQKREGTFQWSVPKRETSGGRLRAEVRGTDGKVVAAGVSDPITVDGTPPALTVTAVPQADQPLCPVTVDAQDPGTGVAQIVLYLTRDGGRTWSEYRRRNAPHFDLDLAREEVPLGLFAQARDTAGNESDTPRPGTPPQAVIPPLTNARITLNELPAALHKGGQRLHLTWQLKGKVPPGATASLALRKGLAEAWETVQAVDLAPGRTLWELPRRSCPALWLRIELALPGGAAVTSNAIGPYAVDGDPPRLTLREKEIYASSSARLQIKAAETGPAQLREVTVYLRKQGETQWQPVASTLEEKTIVFPCLNLSEGHYEVAIVCRDEVGNSTEAPTPSTPSCATLVVDKTPPQISFTPSRSYVEGLEGTLQLTANEAATLRMLFSPEGGRQETVLGKVSVTPGSTRIPFRPLPGASGGVIWFSAVDAAGNRSETEKKPLVIRPAIRFLAPHGGERFPVGSTLVVQYAVDPAFAACGPQLQLFLHTDRQGTRELVADALPVGGSFSWRVPDEPGKYNVLCLEGRVNGVLRASASCPSFAIVKEAEKSVDLGTRRVRPVDSLSLDRSREGVRALQLLREVLSSGEAEKAEALKRDAEREFRAALTIDPTNDEALFGLSQLYLSPFAEKENLTEAAKYLSEAVEHNPGNREAWAYLGVVRLRTGASAQAESALGRALNLGNATDPFTRYNLGLALLRQKKYGPALDQFRYATTQAATAGPAYLCMIQCYVALGRLVKAQETLAETEKKKILSPQQTRKWWRYLKARIAARQE